ncbi:MAG: hypothetical protein WD135_06610 [Ferruginibacter sp.]
MQENAQSDDTIRIDSDSEGNIFYIIPQRYRKMENLHIVFWLFKDISWCMLWKPLGILMVFPTLLIAVIISWRTRNKISELCHNLAIVLWISANSYWMISEFFKFDAFVIAGGFTYKHIALLPFVLGILVLGWYYLWYALNEKRKTAI